MNDQELIINAVTDTSIDLLITHGVSSGEVKLNFIDGEIIAGHLEIKAQEKILLHEEVIESTGEQVIVESDEIDIIFPENVVEGRKTLKIESLLEPNPINLPLSVTGEAFSITLEDQHKFEGMLTIKYRMPPESFGEPSAAYFNEASSLWETLPSEVINGELLIYTNHLTDFFVFYWGEAIYSDDGYFKIHYKKDDKVSYTSTMDKLAKQVGQVLEHARKDYEAVIPAAYRENFQFLGEIDSLDVYIDSDYPHCKYNPVTNNILLPTNFNSTDDFETVLSHEFFHVYQDAVWNEINFIGKMTRSDNRWAVEALAELMAYELAFPEKDRRRKLTGGVTSNDPFNTFDETHEYSMSCYLSYLLAKSGYTADELWVHVVDRSDNLIEHSINDFFRSNLKDFISLEDSYAAYWRDVVGNSDVIEHSVLMTLFYDRIKSFKLNEHTTSMKYSSVKPDTMAFGMIGTQEFSENIPKRIFNVELTNDSHNGIYCTQVKGVSKFSELYNVREAGGFLWTYLSLTGDQKSIYYSFDSGLENKILIEFEFYFDKIFTKVTSMTMEIDFGDGQIEEFQKVNEHTRISEVVSHSYEQLISTYVRCDLYDTTKGKKELIVTIQIPTIIDQELSVVATPNPGIQEELVGLVVVLAQNDYTYKWNLGDGTTYNELGLSQIEHTYTVAGTYHVVVNVYDELDEYLGRGMLNMVINEPELKESAGSWKWSGMTLTLEEGGVEWRFVNILSFYSDGTCMLQIGTEGLNPDTSEDIWGTYIFDSTSSGIVTFANAAEGGYLAEHFSINGDFLYLYDEEFKKAK